MQYADRLDLAQEEELAALEGRSLRNASDRARHMRLASLRDYLLTRHVYPGGPEPPASAWAAVERAAHYMPLACPACHTRHGAWHSVAPPGAIQVDGPTPPGYWETWLGPRRPAQVWVCARGHATHYPATVRVA